MDLDGPRALSLGFDAWVPKPFRAEGVLAAIESLLWVKLVKDATVQQSPASAAAETSSETFDIQTLSEAERAHLRELLTLGDISTAAEWAKALGSKASALVAEISSYRTDALLAKLKHSGPGEVSQGTHKA